jgi:hypothetical protein
MPKQPENSEAVKSKRSLGEFLTDYPFSEFDLGVEREKDFGREIELELLDTEGSGF